MSWRATRNRRFGRALPASRVELRTTTENLVCSTLLLRTRDVDTVLLLRSSKPCKRRRRVVGVVRCDHEPLPEGLEASAGRQTALPERSKRVVRMRSFPKGRYLVSSDGMLLLLQSLPEADRFASTSHQRFVITDLLQRKHVTTAVRVIYVHCVPKNVHFFYGRPM